MDENLTSHAEAQIPGNGLILSGSNPDRNPRQNFTKFHTDSTQKGVSGWHDMRNTEKPPTQNTP
jgi:hypothetical protein